MTDEQTNKLKRFLEDAALTGAVYQVLLDTFLKPMPNADVQKLAASRLAVDFLKDAWHELDRYRAELARDVKNQSNIGI